MNAARRLHVARNRQRSSLCRWRRRPLRCPFGTAARRGARSAAIGAPRALRGFIRATDRGVVAGRGVVADRPLPANHPLLVLTGVIRSLSPDGDDYAFSMAEAGFPDLVLDMRGPRSNIARFVNSAHGARRRPNCEVLWHGCLPVLYTTRPVPRARELLLPYEW